MNDKWNLFENYIKNTDVNISVSSFVINSILLIVASWILSITYQKTGKSLSNKKDFSANFMMLAFTTMLVITIVKSSLALSLGLVGALSIVRFRAAIKEPEELSFLFFSISLGLGLGANQTFLVIIAFIILMIILWGKYLFNKKYDNEQNLFLSINSSKENIQINVVQNILAKYFSNYQLKRYDEQNGTTELSFNCHLKNTDNIEPFRNELIKTYPGISISFIENTVY